jgi:hypothetical protein
VECLAKKYPLERSSVDPAEGWGWRSSDSEAWVLGGRVVIVPPQGALACFLRVHCVQILRLEGSLNRVCELETKTVGQQRGFPSVTVRPWSFPSSCPDFVSVLDLPVVAHCCWTRSPFKFMQKLQSCMMIICFLCM